MSLHCHTNWISRRGMNAGVDRSSGPQPRFKIVLPLEVSFVSEIIDSEIELSPNYKQNYLGSRAPANRFCRRTACADPPNSRATNVRNQNHSPTREGISWAAACG